MEAVKKIKEPSIASIIRAAGFDYRPSRYDGKREVFSVASGKVVGQFEAHEALAYVRALPTHSQTAVA